MDKQTIIQLVIDSKVIDKVASSLYNILGELRDDFIQEMYIIILDMPEEKLMKLYNDGALYFYLVKIARNQAIYYKSDFNKKMKLVNIPLVKIDTIDIENYE